MTVLPEPLQPELLLALLLGCAASVAVAGLSILVLSRGRRGWPALLAGLIAAIGLCATGLPGNSLPFGPLHAAPLPLMALLLLPAVLVLAILEAARAAQATRPLRLGLIGAAAILAILALAAGLTLPDALHLPVAAAAGLLAGLVALVLLQVTVPIAIALCLAGLLPGLALLLLSDGLAPSLLLTSAAAVSLLLVMLALLLVRSLDLEQMEAQVWERAEAEVGEEADRRVAQALAEEVNERGRLEDRLIRATTVDAVSGVATRAHFLSSARALYRQQRESAAAACAIAIVAIDELREINAYYGFKGGDATLAAIGRAIRDLGNGEVQPCRWSGGCFCIWLQPKRGQSAVLLAERLRGTLSATQVPLPEGRFQVTVSVGVAADRDGQGLDRVIASAEAALKDAIAAGGNRVASV